MKEVLVYAKPIKAKIVCLLDNDCFLSGTNYLEHFIEEFDAGEFGFACHAVLESNNAKFCPSGGGKIIYEVHEVKFQQASDGLTLEPHFENSFCLIRKEVFDSMKKDDFDNDRTMMKGIHDSGRKMGMHRASYAGVFSHYGPEWFHVGNLMFYYYAVENCLFEKVRAGNETEVSRIGYFAAMQDDAGAVFPASFADNLERFYEKVGGQGVALAAWRKLTEGTCMQDWKQP